MKYHHRHHAGNFADVHKHVALLALLASLQRKDKGFLYLDTHAGRGAYSAQGASSAGTSHEADLGIERIAGVKFQAEELRHYSQTIAAYRKQRGDRRAYPGSPLLAAQNLRSQDRGVAVEIDIPEARALELALGAGLRVRVERGDGFERLRAHLPPRERRGFVLIDPPYEETREDFDRVIAAAVEALRRFDSGVICAWYPIKEERDIAAWKSSFAASAGREVLFSELWLYPRDSRVGLNGSGLAIVNPPYQFFERAQVWLPELHTHLDTARQGGAANQRIDEPATRAAPRAAR